MAKALLGYLHSDQRIPARLGLENQRLRGRVGDLESLVLSLKVEIDRLQTENERLQVENDHWVTEQAAAALEPEMLPA